MSQIKRVAISVPSNIGEGAANRTKAQFVNFFLTSIGSLAELDTQLELRLRLKMIDDECYKKINQLIDRSKALVF